MSEEEEIAGSEFVSSRSGFGIDLGNYKPCVFVSVSVFAFLFYKIGLVASWIWEEHEKNFLLVFNLIFSSCFFLCSSYMGLSSWLLGLVCEEHKEQVEEHDY